MESINMEALQLTKVNTADKIGKILLKKGKIEDNLKDLFLNIFPDFNEIAERFYNMLNTDYCIKHFTRKKDILEFLCKIKEEYDSSVNNFK